MTWLQVLLVWLSGAHGGLACNWLARGDYPSAVVGLVLSVWLGSVAHAVKPRRG